MMKILICGFSGAGKSTWLQELRNNRGSILDFRFYDLDELIAENVGVGPSELGQYISNVGELAFREVELKLLMEKLKSDESFVLSLGGGALNPQIIEYISQYSSKIKLVFLNEEVEICIERIKNDSNRLLSKLTNSELKNLYFKRLDLYLKADLIVSNYDRKLIDGLDRLVHTLSMK